MGAQQHVARWVGNRRRCDCFSGGGCVRGILGLQNVRPGVREEGESEQRRAYSWHGLIESFIHGMSRWSSLNDRTSAPATRTNSHCVPIRQTCDSTIYTYKKPIIMLHSAADFHQSPRGG